tara:strand:- start:2674 stop:3249 length:576 start_codon:yes stop_codon:yes gene_type:complete
MNLNFDIYEYISNKIEYIDEILNFRLINKSCNIIFINYFKNIKVNIFPSITFIKYNECCVCNNKSNDNIIIKYFIYNYDKLPHKSIVHCNKKYCNLMAIKKYLIDIKKNNIYPFCYFNKTEKLFIKANEKYLDFNIIKSIYINTLKLYNNNWYVKCDMVYKHKYIYIKTIDGILDNNLFSWFLKRKLIHIK